MPTYMCSYIQWKNLLADEEWTTQRPSAGQSVKGGEGDCQGQDQVREGQVEDEYVPEHIIHGNIYLSIYLSIYLYIYLLFV